jgi:catechol 2,3-dioxygenase-like lactoylglutathione lyase family enzyme
MIKTEGLTHIQLVVNDLDRSLGFYKQVFGMEEMFRDGPDLVFLRTPPSRDTITLNRHREGVTPGECAGVSHFGLRLVDPADLDRAIDEVCQAGGRLAERGEHSPGVAYAYVTDPDGYVIEL